MVKRALIIFTFNFVLLSATITSAQIEAFESWVPADFAGYLRLKLDSDMLTGLRIGAVIDSLFQPGRFSSDSFNSLNGLIPLSQLDVEGASFMTDIAPWVGSEMIIAYPRFGDNLTILPDQLILIFPTQDIFGATSSLSRIFQGQDLLKRDTYRGSALYLGDKSTVALTPTAVIVGPLEDVKAVLDRQAHEGEGLVDQEAYQAISGHFSGNALVTGFFDGRIAPRALSVLLSGSESTLPLLSALGGALKERQGENALEQALLSGSLEGIGVMLSADTLRIDSFHTSVMLYDADKPEIAADAFNTAVLELIPQNAMIVQSGFDAARAVYDILYALPLTNFAGQALAAFPVRPSAAAASGRVVPPDAEQIQHAVDTLLAALRTHGQLDLERNVIQHLSGSYAFALMPRPNNPTPLNTRFDALFVAQVSDGAAALDGVTRLAQQILDVPGLTSTTIQGHEFKSIRVQAASEPVLTFGLVDDMLLVATGSAADAALSARRGDNRLISRPTWAAVSKEALPQLFANIPALYNTFFPQEGGQTLNFVNELGARIVYQGDGLYYLDILVTLPGRFG